MNSGEQILRKVPEQQYDSPTRDGDIESELDLETVMEDFNNVVIDAFEASHVAKADK